MSMTILVVKSEGKFTSRLTTMLSPHAATLKVHIVNSRREALAVLEKTSFEQIITSLKIPGVNDGYRFLSQIVNKVIVSNKIIALVDQNIDGVRAGIAAIGLQHIYATDDLEGIVKVILQNAGLASPTVRQVDKLSATGPKSDQIRSALSQVMGPVGSLIYRNALNLWTDQNNPAELVRLIATEIGEDEQIAQFNKLLK
ncbi:MAG: hypothetical protein V2B20_27685 [Pseudomonadota bacterium]